MPISIDIRQTLATQPIDLPVFNAVALNVLELTSKTDTNINDIVSSICEDQSLAAQVLKMANSAAFAGLSRMDTIKASVVRLGAKQVANLVMTAAQASLHKSGIELYNTLMHELYCHSNASAIGCWWLAENSGNKDLAEQAYMAGLLHDIGKLYLLKTMELLCLARHPDFKLDRKQLVNVFTELHIEQGCRIMDHWNIPPVYRTIVAEHHLEQLNPDNKLLAIVRLVNILTRKSGLSLHPESTEATDYQAEIKTLDLNEEQLGKLETIIQGYAEMSGLEN